MKLPEIAIKNYRFVLLVFILLATAGIQSYFKMPRTEDPEMTVPGASVYVVMPGASPSDMEELVSIPIETAINELDDIKKISSSIRDGFASIAVEFYFGTDAEKKYDEVLQKVNSIKNDLPDEVSKIIVFRWATSDVCMLQLALVSDSAGLDYLKNKAENLKNELEKIPGVKKSGIHALPDWEIQITPDFQKMAEYNISPEKLINILESNNINIPGGDVVLSRRAFPVESSGAYKSLEEIRNTVIGTASGQNIYLKNFADVVKRPSDTQYIARYNGHRAVFITVNQKEGRNIYEIYRHILPVLNRFKASLSDDCELHTVFNQVEEVSAKVKKFQNNLFQGIVVVGLVILLALGIRSSLVVIIAIPLSIILGLFVVDVSGYGLQQISIAGLIISLGLLVDNSIVVVENINRYMDKGYTSTEAAIKAVSEIGWPVVSATFTTIFAFIPIMLMPEKAGVFIRSLPLTISVTLLFSMLIALSLNPVIASRLFKPVRGKGNFFQNRFFKSAMDKFIQGPYSSFLEWSLNHKTVVVTFSVLMLIFSGWLFYQTGLSFFPKAEKPEFIIRIKLPDDASLARTNQVCREIEQSLDTLSLVEYYASNIGHGNPRIYYNIVSNAYYKNFAEIFVKLKYYETKSYEKFIAHLRDMYREYPGARIQIKELQQGVPVAAPIVISLYGEDFDLLASMADSAEKWLSHQEGVLNLENDMKKSKTVLKIDINKDKASMLGVPVYRIDRAIRMVLSGWEVSTFHAPDGKTYPMVIQSPLPLKKRIEELGKIHVESLAGKQIPLDNLIHIRFKESPASINRAYLSRTANITADVAPGYNIDNIMKPVIQKLKSFPFPDGYGYRIEGELEARQESFGGMFDAMIIAILAIFAVLVLQFNSFVQPLIIFITVPFAVIGMTLALYISNLTFSFTAFIGLISLIGIVVNNAIILVDFTNKNIEEGISVREAVMQAGQIRFTPIILTTLTTIGGILPLTLGGGTLWAPLGATLVGGLIFSTFLSLIMVPVFYEISARKIIPAAK